MGDRTVVVGVEVIAAPGAAISYEIWRAFPIGTLLRLATEETVDAIAAGLAAHADGVPRLSEAHLRAVASVYRYALSQDVPPRATIRDAFGLKVPEDGGSKTVDRGLHEARQRNLLGTWADEKRANESREP
jgi:hypothetical protein